MEASHISVQTVLLVQKNSHQTLKNQAKKVHRKEQAISNWLNNKKIS
jgi:hypothetical protein